jgi:hypothetical protein
MAEASTSASLCLLVPACVALLPHFAHCNKHSLTLFAMPLPAVTHDTNTAPEPSSSSDSSSGSYLLSLDAEGWVGLWDASSWVCLDMSRAAPLPPACTPTLLAMVSGGGGQGGGSARCVLGGGARERWEGRGFGKGMWRPALVSSKGKSHFAVTNAVADAVVDVGRGC